MELSKKKKKKRVKWPSKVQENYKVAEPYINISDAYTFFLNQFSYNITVDTPCLPN